MVIVTALSAIIGFIGALLGVGGGTFLMPVLVMVLGFPLVEAIPITQFCTLATGVSGVFFSKLDDDVLKKAFVLEPGAIFGAMIAAPLAYVLSSKIILLLFSVLIFILAIMASRLKTPSADMNFNTPKKKVLIITGLLSSAISGVCAGLFGIGGGIVLVPLLRMFSGVSLKEAAQISLFIMISTSTIALLVHTTLGEIKWMFGLASAAGAIPAAMAATMVRRKISDKKVNKMFLFFAFGVSIMIFTKAFSTAN